MSGPKLALHFKFLEAYARLPGAQQRKVQQMIRKFRENPRAPGLHYEKLQGSRDPNIRTLRVDQAYRAVLLQPDEDQVAVLLWVDHHDEANTWAERHQAEVHPKTGALQLLDVGSLEARGQLGSDPPPKPAKRGRSKKAPSPALFDLPDETLIELGVPYLLLPAVKALTSEAQLDGLEGYLPAEVHEALIGLRAGMTLEEIQGELAERTREAVAAAAGTEGLEAALAHPDTRRSVAVIESDELLDSMLAAPLERWRVFLHPSQERLVRRRSKGPMRVLGGAGTGKTVVGLHRARFLARERLAADERLLVTTFTANLASDLAATLDEFCGPERARIDVIHLHRWAVQFMRGRGVRYKIPSERESDDAWQAALSEGDPGAWERSFLQGEWRDVIQAQGLRDEAEYLRARRRGRGVRLNREDRRRLWRICEAYRDVLAERGWTEWVEVIREARRTLERSEAPRPYRCVVVDEAQDFHEEEWKLIRLLAPEAEDDLTLVGDAHQRIYGRPVRLTQLGINIRGRRSARLKLNYRTTEEIRDFALAVLAGTDVDDLDGGQDSDRGERSLLHGPRPEVRVFANPTAEHQGLVEIVRGWIGEGVRAAGICVVARTRKLRDGYRAALARAEVPTAVLEGDRIDGDPEGVHLATMHRVKGLEFPRMILAGMDEGVVPAPVDESDPLARAEAEQRERCLVYVAASRARDVLVVTSSGRVSGLVRGGT